MPWWDLWSMKGIPSNLYVCISIDRKWNVSTYKFVLVAPPPPSPPKKTLKPRHTLAPGPLKLLYISICAHCLGGLTPTVPEDPPSAAEEWQQAVPESEQQAAGKGGGGLLQAISRATVAILLASPFFLIFNFYYDFELNFQKLLFK